MGYNRFRIKGGAHVNNDISIQIAELEAQIAAFPPGSISQKQVKGKTYYYHRFREDGKRKERYISENDVAALRDQIDQIVAGFTASV